MADTTKMENHLIIEVGFIDGDTRTITLKNPRSNLTASDIENLDNFMKTNNILIGDRDSADFKKIRQAKTRSAVITTLDLSSND